MTAPWMSDAACRDEDPDIFFPEKGGTSEAKEVCRACPVSGQCTEFAAAIGATAGVWGGRLVKTTRAAGSQSLLQREIQQRDEIILRLASSRSAPTDTEIAARAGCDARTVQRVRARHDISRKEGRAVNSFVMPDRGWRARAACRDEDPELFFPPSGAPANDPWVTEAKRVCAGCPVMTECLIYAIENRDQGVWGGTTDEERRRELKRRGRIKARGRGGGRKPAPCGTDAAYRRHIAKGEWVDDLCAQTRERGGRGAEAPR